MSTDTTQMLQQMFQSTDSNSDGSLSLSEFKAGTSTDTASGSATSSKLDQLFTKLDTNSDGSLSQDEFTTGLSSQGQQVAGAGGPPPGGPPPGPPPSNSDDSDEDDLITQLLDEILNGTSSTSSTPSTSSARPRWARASPRRSVPTPYETTIDVAAHQKAADYTVAKTRLSVIDIGLQAALLLGWTLLGGLDALNKALLDVMQPGLWQQIALVVSFTSLGSALELPMGWYQTFSLEAQFGFNRTTLRVWAMDGLKGAAIGTVIGIPILGTVLWLMSSAGSTWWVWAWGVFMGFDLLLMVIYPTVIAPMFNTLDLARKLGFELKTGPGVVEMRLPLHSTPVPAA